MLVCIERAWDEGRELTDEARSAREMVCCARVMVAIWVVLFVDVNGSIGEEDESL